MKSLIAGLFSTQESANLAYEALQTAGVRTDDIHMFVHRPPRQVARSMDVKIQDIARNALIGSLIGAVIGGLIGWLVGSGEFSLPYLEPGSAPREPLFTFMSVVWGVIAGVLTGAILGVATRLLKSPEKAEVMTTAIQKRGVLVAVSAADPQTEGKARDIMQEYAADEIGNPSEKWNVDDWWSPNKSRSTSLRNLITPP